MTGRNQFFLTLAVTISLFAGGCGSGSGGGSSSNDDPQIFIPTDGETSVNLTLDSPVILEDEPVNSTGAVITVDKPGDPLDGLELTIPNGSYEEQLNFIVSHQTISGVTGNPNFDPVTPLISVANGGKYAQTLMTVKIPVAIDPDYHYMAFYVDEDGKLEGIPTLSQDSSSITIATRHFSKIVINRVDLAGILTFGYIHSNYKVGQDNWQFINNGSYLSPNGICHGMSISSLYYFDEKKKAPSYTPLYGRFDASTPNYDLDDEDAIKFTSVTQVESDFSKFTALIERYKQLSSEQSLKHDAKQFFSFAHAILLTGQPQYIAVMSNDLSTGHALVAYRKDGTKIMLADPNKPDSSDIYLEFVFNDKEDVASDGVGQFLPYYSALEANGVQVDLSKVFYAGKSAIIDTHFLDELYVKLLAGTIGDDEFPSKYIIMKEFPNNQHGGSESEQTLFVSGHNEDSVSTYSAVIELELGSAEFEDAVLDADSAQATIEGLSPNIVKLTLKPGENRIALLANALIDQHEEWVDHQTLNITYLQCKEGEELVNGQCQPPQCERVCSNPIIADNIDIPAYGGAYSINLKFNNNYKMCAAEIDDTDSMNDKTTMLYFYTTDGNTNYKQPSPITSSGYEFATASINTAYEDFTISMSPLPDYNSNTFKYFDPETRFGFDVHNFSSLSDDNEYDFLWLNVLLTANGSWQRTIVNTEWVPATGCYAGNY